MQHDINQAAAFISALTGDVNTIVDFRAISDTNKGVPAIPMRGTLSNMWQSLTTWNAAGYGIFIAIQQLDGIGRHLENVDSIRTHVIDLDDLARVQQSFNEAANWYPAPSFSVNSSPGKHHIYWCSTPYDDNNRYQVIERKLVAKFGGDPQVIDAARVMRLPGTFHLKNPQQPHLVTCAALPGYGLVTPPELLEHALSDIQVAMGGGGGRHELGDSELAAPSKEWAVAALKHVDPNNLDRAEWITVTSAFKQSIWSHTNPDDAFAVWSEWCAQYDQNDTAENRKQWDSIRNTEVGFKNLARRSSNVLAHLRLGVSTIPTPPTAHYSPAVPDPMPGQRSTAAMPTAASAVTQPFGTILTEYEQPEYFKGCTFIKNMGKIFVSAENEFMDAGTFNASFGGKIFILDAEGNTTDEPWKAATRGRIFTVPKVNHIRFLPHIKPGETIIDDLGRQGVNMYVPSIIRSRRGDPSPFLRHLQLLFPVASDLNIYLSYIAHNVRYPGVKIPWAPVLISTEGAGKGLLAMIIRHCMGASRCYNANPTEMQESGNKFNSWMRNRLFIIADEIKVDDRRELVEILKPMLTDEQIQIQAKGKDQNMEDNYSNWQFHSNWKDAIPVDKNGRRYAIFYLAPQSADDLLRLGMDDNYFKSLLDWLRNGYGLEIIADYLLNYPIECGSLPGRAPVTSSMPEAIVASRGALETLLHELVEDGRQGFRGGWASVLAFKSAAKEAGIQVRSDVTVGKVFESAGFKRVGRALRPYFAENPKARATLYAIDPHANVAGYGLAQGYDG